MEWLIFTVGVLSLVLLAAVLLIAGAMTFQCAQKRTIETQERAIKQLESSVDDWRKRAVAAERMRQEAERN